MGPGTDWSNGGHTEPNKWVEDANQPAEQFTNLGRAKASRFVCTCGNEQQADEMSIMKHLER